MSMRWSLQVPLLLSLLRAQLTMTATRGLVSAQSHLLTSRCGPHEYWAGCHCCLLCPPGQYVRESCRSPHTQGTCEKCDTGMYTAFPNNLESCLPCSICSYGQKEVAQCTLTSNRKCQCRTGRFYSPDSPEFCRRCSTCPQGVAVLQKCHSTADTVCDLPGPGKAASGSADSSQFVNVGVPIIAVIALIAVIAVCISIGIGIYYCRRSGNSSEPGSRSLGTIQPSTLPAADPERGPPAPGEATTPLLQEEVSALAPGAGTHPGPSEEPGEDTELQEVVTGGSQAAPEQELQTAVPAALGLQGQPEAAASLRHLEQEYKKKYILKDMSCDANNKLYYEFGRKVPANDWKMFMKLVGLRENDIDICEHENPGNLREQYYKMLVRWRNRQGRDTSPFTLMAALHKMELHEELENIINHLVAENILGRHAETPN